jgi:hypothetical protein
MGCSASRPFMRQQGKLLCASREGGKWIALRLRLGFLECSRCS